jgi:hypothetical protein
MHPLSSLHHHHLLSQGVLECHPEAMLAGNEIKLDELQARQILFGGDTKQHILELVMLHDIHLDIFTRDVNQEEETDARRTVHKLSVSNFTIGYAVPVHNRQQQKKQQYAVVRISRYLMSSDTYTMTHSCTRSMRNINAIKMDISTSYYRHQTRH